MPLQSIRFAEAFSCSQRFWLAAFPLVLDLLPALRASPMLRCKPKLRRLEADNIPRLCEYGMSTRRFLAGALFFFWACAAEKAESAAWIGSQPPRVMSCR